MIDRPITHHPVAMVAPAVALTLVSLLFAVDSSTQESSRGDRQGQSVPVEGSDDDPATGPTTTSTTAPLASEPSTSAVQSSVSSTEPAIIEELGVDEISDALADAGFPDIEIEIAGATVTLRGRVPDAPSQRAVLNQVGQVPGVEVIVDELTVG